MLRKRACPVRGQAERKRTSPNWHLAARPSLLTEISESAENNEPPKTS